MAKELYVSSLPGDNRFGCWLYNGYGEWEHVSFNTVEMNSLYITYVMEGYRKKYAVVIDDYGIFYARIEEGAITDITKLIDDGHSVREAIKMVAL